MNSVSMEIDDSVKQIDDIQQRIHSIRGQRVMLDFDLAELYEVETKVLNQAVKRNRDRFPIDFMFQLSENEWAGLRSQFVTLENGRGKYPKYLPNVFTEHGITMLASVLKNARAIKMNIAVVRAFIAIRQLTSQHQFIFEQLSALKIKIGEHDEQLTAIYEAIENLLDEKSERRNWV